MCAFPTVREIEMTFPGLGELEASWEKQNSCAMLSWWQLGEMTSSSEKLFLFLSPWEKHHCKRYRTCRDDPCPLFQTPYLFQGVLLLSVFSKKTMHGLVCVNAKVTKNNDVLMPKECHFLMKATLSKLCWNGHTWHHRNLFTAKITRTILWTEGMHFWTG